MFVEFKNVDVIMVLVAKMLTWHIKVNYMKKLCFIMNMSLEDISSVLKWETCLLVSWKSCILSSGNHIQILL